MLVVYWVVQVGCKLGVCLLGSVLVVCLVCTGCVLGVALVLGVCGLITD